MSTRKYDREQRQKREKERAIKSVIGRALKRSGVGVDFATPGQEINALEKYIDDLRAIKAELQEKYPGEIRQLWRLGVELNRAIEAISRLHIAQVKPEK